MMRLAEDTVVKQPNKTKEAFEKLFSHPQRLFLLSVIMLVCWASTLLCLYPGTLINDTWGEMQDFLMYPESHTLYAHHPVFDTIVFVCVAWIGKTTGHWHIAFFVFTLLQASLTCIAFSYSIIYAKDKR